MAIALLAAVAALVVPFGPVAPAARTKIRMGLLDFLTGGEETETGAASISVPTGMVAAHHILLRAEDHGGSEEEAEAEAGRLLARLKAGELSFEEAATQFSSCPSRAQQGNLGTFSGLGRLCWLPYEGEDVAEFDRLVSSDETGVGELYQITTKFGSHIVRVDAR